MREGSGRSAFFEGEERSANANVLSGVISRIVFCGNDF